MSVFGAQGASGSGLDLARIVREERERIEAEEQAKAKGTAKEGNQPSGVLNNMMSNHFKGTAQLTLSINFSIELEGYGGDRMLEAVPEEIQKLMAGFRDTFAEGLKNLENGDTEGLEALVAEFRKNVRGALEEFRNQEQPTAAQLADKLREVYSSMQTSLLEAFMPTETEEGAEDPALSLVDDKEILAEKTTTDDDVATTEEDAEAEEDDQWDINSFLASLEATFEEGLAEMVIALEEASQSPVQRRGHRRMVAMYQRHSQTIVEQVTQAQSSGIAAVDETA